MVWIASLAATELPVIGVDRKYPLLVLVEGAVERVVRRAACQQQSAAQRRHL